MYYKSGVRVYKGIPIASLVFNHDRFAQCLNKWTLPEIYGIQGVVRGSRNEWMRGIRVRLRSPDGLQTDRQCPTTGLLEGVPSDPSAVAPEALEAWLPKQKEDDPVAARIDGGLQWCPVILVPLVYVVRPRVEQELKVGRITHRGQHVQGSFLKPALKYCAGGIL